MGSWRVAGYSVYSNREKLALQEFNLFTAGVFRKYDLYDGSANQGPSLALYETTKQRDVECPSDAVVPRAAPGSKGVRLLVR